MKYNEWWEKRVLNDKVRVSLTLCQNPSLEESENMRLVNRRVKVEKGSKWERGERGKSPSPLQGKQHRSRSLSLCKDSAPSPTKIGTYSYFLANIIFSQKNQSIYVIHTFLRTISNKLQNIRICRKVLSSFNVKRFLYLSMIFNEWLTEINKENNNNNAKDYLTLDQLLTLIFGQYLYIFLL